MKRAQGFHIGTHGLRAAVVAVGIGAAGLLAAGTASAEGTASVMADVQCNPAGGGVLDLTLINERPEQAAVFVVDGSSYTVEVGSATAITYTDLADGVVTVGVTIDGVPAPVSVTVACATAAAPSVEAAPSASPLAVQSAVADDALPRTGSSSGGLLIGAALVASGAVASLVARRRYS